MSAEYAHVFSGNINVITKSGTNQFHGSLFESVQNNIFNAKNAFLRPGDPKPPVHINQFGGSFGGPIIKDKLFFFFTYEGFRQATTGVTSGQVPTADYRGQLLAANPSYKPILDYYPAAHFSHRRQHDNWIVPGPGRHQLARQQHRGEGRLPDQ